MGILEKFTNLGIVDRIAKLLNLNRTTEAAITEEMTRFETDTEDEVIIAAALVCKHTGYWGVGENHGMAYTNMRGLFVPEGKEIDSGYGEDIRKAMTSKGRIVELSEAYKIVKGKPPEEGHSLTSHDFENVVTELGVKVAERFAFRHNFPLEQKYKRAENEHEVQLKNPKHLTLEQRYVRDKGRGD